jgi:hypothetical protein
MQEIGTNNGSAAATISNYYPSQNIQYIYSYFMVTVQTPYHEALHCTDTKLFSGALHKYASGQYVLYWCYTN